MGVFKEHAHAFEAVAQKQARIWNDACDYGYAYNSNNVPQDIKDLIHFVKDLKGTSLMRKYSENKELGYVLVCFRIGWEIDEGFECGTQYKITAHVLNTRMRNGLIKKDATHFISVDIENYREPYKNR